MHDDDHASIITKLDNDISRDPYSLKDEFLLHGSWLCITKNLRKKVMCESHVPPYVGHHGIQVMT